MSNQFFISSHSLHSRPAFGLFLHRPHGGGGGDGGGGDGGTSCDLLAYTPFVHDADALPDPSLSFLPELVSVATSAHGLLYCLARASGGYYICNPTTFAWAALSSPANAYGADPAVALVFDELGIYNFHADYCVICAYPIAGGDCDSIYGFETFSATWNWTALAEICPVEQILAASGRRAPWSLMDLFYREVGTRRGEGRMGRRRLVMPVCWWRWGREGERALCT